MDLLSKKIRQGLVVSDKMDKTRVLLVERKTTHPLYKKVIKRTKRYKYHDENNETKVGDLVEVIECRPLSKEKKWRLKSIINKAI